MKIIISENRSDFHVRLTASDREVFDWMLEEFKGWVPKSYRRYDSDSGRWVVDKYQRERLSVWLHQMDDAGATIIEEDDDYSANYRQREQRHNQRTKGQNQRQKSEIEVACQALHLQPTAPVKLIEAARRILLVECHPDKGGSHEDAVQINRAADELIKVRRLEGSNAA